MGRFPGAQVGYGGSFLPMLAFGLWALVAVGGFVFLLAGVYRIGSSLKRIEAILDKKASAPAGLQKVDE